MQTRLSIERRLSLHIEGGYKKYMMMKINDRGSLEAGGHARTRERTRARTHARMHAHTYTHVRRCTLFLGSRLHGLCAVPGSSLVIPVDRASEDGRGQC